MTNRQYLEVQLSGLGIDTEALDALATGTDLNLEADLNAKACDMALYTQIGFIIARAGNNVSEGGYSISWNIEALKLFYRALCLKLGKPNLLERQGTGRMRYRPL